jgi:hypothetical protein
MLQNLRTFPQLTFQQRRDDTGLKMSNSDIKNLARASGLHHWRAKKRPELTPIRAMQRLAWCLTRKDWTVTKWRKAIFLDECWSERGGKGQKPVWIWGIPAHKWRLEMVTRGRLLHGMVWCMFWDEGNRAKVYTIDYELHDNAPTHSAKKITRWFKEHGVDATDWPRDSPDLNLIADAWKALEQKVCEMFPDIWNYKSDEVAKLRVMEVALRMAWDALPDSLFESLVDSMPCRIKACIEAKGWHTKY